MNKIAIITIDSDTFAEEISCNYSADEREKIINITYKSGIERIFEVIEKYRIKTTFFQISSHLIYDECANELKKIISKGHEISDHTYSHNRNLPVMSEKEIEIEIKKSKEMIEKKLNIIPIGFRTPGAEINLKILSILSKNGYLYDSSLNPSFLYSSLKKIYFVLKKEKFVKTEIPYLSNKPQKIDSLIEFPLTKSVFLTLPVFNFFMFPLGKIGLKIISNTTKKREFINYVIHLHEFVSPSEINNIKISKGLMNICNIDISKKVLFLDKAIKIFTDNFKFVTLKDFYYNIKNESI